MHIDVCNQLRKVKTPLRNSFLRSAGSELIPASAICTATIVIQDRLYVVEFIVLPKCAYDIILGCDFLQSAHAIIDYRTLELSTDADTYAHAVHSEQDNKLRLIEDIELLPHQTSLLYLKTPPHLTGDILLAPHHEVLLRKGIIVPYTLATVSSRRVTLAATNTTNQRVLLPVSFSLANAESTQNATIATLNEQEAATSAKTPFSPSTSNLLWNTIDSSLSSAEQHQLFTVLNKYRSIFDNSSPSLGKTNLVEHRIETGDSATIRHRPYRVSLSERKIIQEHVDEMLQKGVVRHSSSPWSSPVVLVRKKDGSVRFCIDYRRLNKVTRRDVYPLPRIDDALDSLQGSLYFSSLDLRSGYWQIPMAEKDKEKTAFTTPDGLYEFNVMPFGLSNAPATFERMIDAVLRGMKWKTCLCYLDDIIVFSATFHDHLLRLSQVLSCLTNAGLQLNTKKCNFGAKKVKVLGHIVSEAGVSPDPEKIRAVTHFPCPTNVRELRSFLGLASYFRRFVRAFATIAAPLHRLLQTDVPFVWTEPCSTAFTSLQAILTSPPVLCFFDPTAATALHTDASGHGLGAVLVQQQNNSSLEQVIAYASRTLTKPETNYSTTERECLAVVWAINKFRPYLYGRHFKVVTDHHALCWLSSIKNVSGRLGRWVLRLQEYDFAVIHKSGRKHNDADALSRCPVPPSTMHDAQVSTTVLPSILATISSHNFLSAQHSDPWIRPILQHLNGTFPSTKQRFIKKTQNFCLIDGHLYRRNYMPEGRRWLLAVPSEFRSEILHHFHDDLTAGHLGLFKTYARIRNRFFWPGMYRTICKYVRSCPQCQRYKRSSSAPTGLLQPLTPPPKPFDVLGVDLLGPLPQSTTGNRWILVAIDHTTRFVETAALPDATAECVARFLLHHIILRHGAPQVLITDRGHSFLAQTVEALLQACKVDHRTTSPYHPQTNGLTERFNHTLTKMISMYINSDHSNWDTILPFVTFAYNTAVQTTTGFSPFYLLYGRDPSSTLDTILPYPNEHPDNDLMTQFTSSSEASRQLARSRTLQHQDASKRRYDAQHRDVHYLPGDLVLIFFPFRQTGRCEKFLPKFKGPYKVIRQTSPVNYLVEPVNPPSDRRTTGRHIVHVGRLKMFYQRLPPS